MSVLRLSMHEADRQTYGGPEWLDDDEAIDALNDLDLDELKAIERETRSVLDLTLIRLSATSVFNWSIDHLRGRLWLALRHAGVDVKLADFTPVKILRTDMDFGSRGADADPPSSGPDSSATSTSTTST